MTLGTKGAGNSFLISASQSMDSKKGWRLILSVPEDPDPNHFLGSLSKSFEMMSEASEENSFLSTKGLSVIKENSSLLFLE